MTDPTAEFFEELGRRGHEPRLEKVSGTVRVDLDQGKDSDHWLITINHGDVAVSRKNAKADSIFHTDKALFDRMATGQANAMAAILRGVAIAEGNPELLVLFQRLLPGPGNGRDRRNTVGAGRRQP